MKDEKSCGAVVFTKIGEEIKYLLIRSLRGVYGFPKGHTEGDETETETALREVLEETGLKITFLDGFRETDEYFISRKKNIVKRVTYFLGFYEDQEIHFQRQELSGAFLVSYEEAMQLLQFESGRRILKEANEYLDGCR